MNVNIQVNIPVPEVVVGAAKAASGALEVVSSAMSKGIAKMQTLKSIVGQANGARDILTASI